MLCASAVSATWLAQEEESNLLLTGYYWKPVKTIALPEYDHVDFVESKGSGHKCEKDQIKDGKRPQYNSLQNCSRVDMPLRA